MPFLALLLALIPAAASAQVTSLTGTVRDAAGVPTSAARVEAIGQNLDLEAVTDAAGRFAFPALTVGDYTVIARKDGLIATAEVSLASGGAEVTLALAPTSQIAHTIVSRTPTATRSGTDVTLGATQLARMPADDSISGILTQLPSAARGSNGQIHVNGDHNGLNYYLDGVQLPSSLNRVLGNEVDPSTIGFLDALEGAYPAQYGDRFAAVLDIGTRVSPGPAGATFEAQGGSLGASSTLGYHAPIGDGGSLSVAGNWSQGTRGVDPPVTDYVHDAASNASTFLRFSLPVRGDDNINFDAIHSVQTFQIPPDTTDGISPQTDDDEYQTDTFLSLQYHHAIGSRGSLSFGPSLKVSHLLDTNDLENDLGPGLAPPAPGTTNCTDFSDCPYFSVYADRLARDYRFNADYDLRSPRHEVRAGILYDASVVDKLYDITLQPYTQLNPLGTYTVTDTSPNVAHQQEAYLQDSWKMGSLYELDYGLRADAFQIFSDGFDRGFSQVSPRIKLTRMLGSRASVYAYYGRLFVPFSFENVSPATAAALYTAANNPGSSFDLLPQRDSLYELGGHVALGSGDLGVRISHKVSTNWLDDTQVGATNLHQDINFPRGRVDLQSLYYQLPTARGGRVYAALTHSIAVNSLNCETQLLQNCAAAGPPGGDFAQADHDQHWDANAGILSNDTRGGWFAASAEYGSGLSLADASDCITDDAVNCKVPPHLTFDVEKGFALGSKATVAIAVDNLLDDRYAITLDSALQGTHYAAPRSFSVELRMRN
jgi:hypothetical protein